MFLDQPQVCVLVAVVRIIDQAQRDPRIITVDEKSLIAFLEKACGPRTLDVIVCLFACDVPVMILNTPPARNATEVRTVTFQFVLVVGRGPCHSLLYLASDTVPARGLGARGVFKPCLSFMTLCPTP